MAVDPLLEIAVGNTPSRSVISKFGRSVNIDSGVDTDIWDGANANDPGTIWVCPTAPRKHMLRSTNLNDKAGGSGARTLRVYGLPSWSSPQVDEDVILNGTVAVLP